MRFMNGKSYTAALCVLSGMSLLGACGKYITIETNQSNRDYQVNNDSLGELGSKRKSSLKELSLLSRLPNPAIGLVQYKTIDAPVILPATVHDPALLFQIYRCPANTRIQGVVSEFDDLIGQTHTDAKIKEFFAINMFWNDVKLKCESVADAQPQIEFIDLTAPSGDWRWFVRACLPNVESNSFICSDVVTASAPLLGFQNKLDNRKQELLTRITHRISAIRQISASFPAKAATLAEAYERCNTSEWEKTKRLLKRSILANVIGYGSAILIDILAPNTLKHATPNKSIVDRINAIWDPRVDTVPTGQAITRILLWLFTSKDDFKETCSAAEEIKINATADLNRVKDLQLLLAADTNEAQQIGLEIPEGLLP
ncbi:MAG: hypothetical protein RI932_2645 [Pseudomonadota bacterium]|jgi:hypothetical protein